MLLRHFPAHGILKKKQKNSVNAKKRNADLMENSFHFFFKSMNDVRASFRRVLKYVIPVIVFAILFNIPKFFEAEVLKVTDQYGNMHLELGVTKLRKDPLYATYYSSWARSAVTGIIPFCLLAWFNMKIYQDIQVNTLISPLCFLLRWIYIHY